MGRQSGYAKAVALNQNELEAALAEIQAEQDPTVRHLKLASLCSAVFLEHGLRLVVVVGSAIEFYTEGAYVSGDLDLCVESGVRTLTPALRQEIMARFGAVGGPRSWQVAGSFVDVLSTFENLARTPIRILEGPFGGVRISPVKELIVERVLVGHYTGLNHAAVACARKLLAAALSGEIETDWNEVQRLAQSNAYGNWNDVKQLVDEQAQALQLRNP